MLNEDHNKIQKKIINELSKPLYPFLDKSKSNENKSKEALKGGTEEKKDSKNDYEIRKTVNYAKLID